MWERCTGFCRPAINWRQLSSQRGTRTIVHLSVSSLRSEEVSCLCRLLVELRIVHAFHGSYIVAYGVGSMLDTLRLRALEEDIYLPTSKKEGCFQFELQAQEISGSRCALKVQLPQPGHIERIPAQVPLSEFTFEQSTSILEWLGLDDMTRWTSTNACQGRTPVETLC